MPRTATIARSASVSKRSSRKSAIGCGSTRSRARACRLVQAPEVEAQPQRARARRPARRVDGSGGVSAIEP